jgi:hypothetical protein
MKVKCTFYSREIDYVKQTQIEITNFKINKNQICLLSQSHSIQRPSYSKNITWIFINLFLPRLKHLNFRREAPADSWIKILSSFQSSILVPQKLKGTVQMDSTVFV